MKGRVFFMTGRFFAYAWFRLYHDILHVHPKFGGIAVLDAIDATEAVMIGAIGIALVASLLWVAVRVWRELRRQKTTGTF